MQVPADSLPPVPAVPEAAAPAQPAVLPALADERRTLEELETEVAAIEAELRALD
jgi:hypothetical protein